MSNLGLGVMNSMLSCRSDEAALRNAIGKTLKSIKLNKEHNALELHFEDGTGLALWDDGQSCCEARYMTCDDDLTELAGAVLKDIELREKELTP